jgi:hypothetical protein
MPPKPTIKVPVHVFLFSLASVPGIAYAMYWKKNHETDEEFESKLRENYGTKIEGSKDKKAEMVKFFQAMKDPNANPEQDKKMMSVLHGGKGDIKRHYAVDESLYGTEEGVLKRKEAEEGLLVNSDGSNETKKKKKKKKNRKRKKKQESNNNNDDNNSIDDTGTGAAGNSETDSDGQVKSAIASMKNKNLPSTQQAVAVTAATAVGVGALAVVASLIAGKKGS